MYGNFQHSFQLFVLKTTTMGDVDSRSSPWPPSDTSVPPAQFPSPDGPRRVFPATLRAPAVHDPQAAGPPLHPTGLPSVLSSANPRPDAYGARSRLSSGSAESAPPVAFRWLLHKQTRRFAPCGTLQRHLRLPRPHLHPATLGVEFKRRSLVSKSPFMALPSCPSSRALRMCSPTSLCCRGMLPISTTSTSER